MPKRGQYSGSAKPRSKYQRGYNSKPASKKDRASRNSARRLMSAKGKASDVDHKDGNPRNNKRSNLRLMSKRGNRSGY
jgi:hypothetical protein